MGKTQTDYTVLVIKATFSWGMMYWRTQKSVQFWICSASYLDGQIKNRARKKAYQNIILQEKDVLALIHLVLKYIFVTSN